MHGEGRHLVEMDVVVCVVDGRHLVGASAGVPSCLGGCVEEAPPLLLSGGRKAQVKSLNCTA